MVAKLKLARELIPWSLVIKGVIFAVAWLLLPYLLFLMVAAFVFYNPPFQATRFSPIFLLIAWLAYLFSSGIREAIFLVVLFVTALGIKNLIFIDRVLVAQVFLVAASFLLWLALFSAKLWPSFSFLPASLAVILIMVFLFRFMFGLGQVDRLAPTPLFLLVLFSLFSFQFSWVLSLLPAESISQAVFMAVGTALFIEFYSGYLSGFLTRQKLIILSFGFLIALVFLILSLPFSLTP
jgi:hypothetical protein